MHRIMKSTPTPNKHKIMDTYVFTQSSGGCGASDRLGSNPLVDRPNRSITHSLTHSTNQPTNHHTVSNQLTIQSTNHSTNQPVNQSTNISATQPTNQLTSLPTNQPTNQPINQPANQPTSHSLLSQAVVRVEDGQQSAADVAHAQLLLGRVPQLLGRGVGGGEVEGCRLRPCFRDAGLTKTTAVQQQQQEEEERGGGPGRAI